MSVLCGHCRDSLPSPELLYKVDWWQESVCGACKRDKEVDSARASAEAAAASLALAVQGTWDSEIGKLLKAERNGLLDANRWTVMPDSPLTVVNQGEWLQYLRALQSLTIIFPSLTGFKATDGKWKWPTKPALKYASVTVSASASVSVK